MPHGGVNPDRTSALPRWTGPLSLVLILLAVAVAYHGTFRVPFLLDDEVSIVENPSLRQLASFPGALSPPAFSGVGGRPAANLSFAINYALGELDVGSYHAVNLLLHAASALALYGLIRRTLLSPLLRERWTGSAPLVAAAAALLWAVHPVQTAAVTYISQRTELLMALSYLLTLYCVARSCEAPSRRWPVLAVACGLLGMASKEVMITAPVLALLYDRTFFSGSFAVAWQQRRWLYLGLAATWVPLIFLLEGLQGHRGVGFGLELSAWDYALTESIVVLRYLGLAVWPQPLVFDYGPGMAVHRFAEAAPHALALSAILGGTVVLLWRRPALGFVAASFFLILSPTSSVIPISLQPMAENRLYLPLAAIVIGFVLAAFALLQRWALALVACVALLLTITTVHRNEVFRDEFTLWQDTVHKQPGNSRAHNNLGNLLLARGRGDEAITAFETARRLDPSSAEAHYNLGQTLLDRGRVDEAFRLCAEAVRLKPADPKAHNNLGNVFLATGRIDEAALRFETALRLRPAFPEAHNNLAVVRAKQNRLPEALAHWEETLRLRPGLIEARFNYAVALARLNRKAEALAQFEACLRQKPDLDAARRLIAELRTTP